MSCEHRYRWREDMALAECELCRHRVTREYMAHHNLSLRGGRLHPYAPPEEGRLTGPRLVFVDLRDMSIVGY